MRSLRVCSNRKHDRFAKRPMGLHEDEKKILVSAGDLDPRVLWFNSNFWSIQWIRSFYLFVVLEHDGTANY